MLGRATTAIKVAAEVAWKRGQKVEYNTLDLYTVSFNMALVTCGEEHFVTKALAFQCICVVGARAFDAVRESWIREKENARIRSASE